jgi:sulfite reductase beta subunit-like hemoprotein
MNCCTTFINSRKRCITTSTGLNNALDETQENLRGRSNEADGTNIGERVKARIPAKRAPEALKAGLNTYLAERNDDEEFADFID